jgi:hypothetical protein
MIDHFNGTAALTGVNRPSNLAMFLTEKFFSARCIKDKIWNG